MTQYPLPVVWARLGDQLDPGTLGQTNAAQTPAAALAASAGNIIHDPSPAPATGRTITARFAPLRTLVGHALSQAQLRVVHFASTPENWRYTLDGPLGLLVSGQEPIDTQPQLHTLAGDPETVAAELAAGVSCRYTASVPVAAANPLLLVSLEILVTTTPAADPGRPGWGGAMEDLAGCVEDAFAGEANGVDPIEYVVVTPGTIDTQTLARTGSIRTALRVAADRQDPVSSRFGGAGGTGGASVEIVYNIRAATLYQAAIDAGIAPFVPKAGDKVIDPRPASTPTSPAEPAPRTLTVTDVERQLDGALYQITARDNAGR